MNIFHTNFHHVKMYFLAAAGNRPKCVEYRRKFRNSNRKVFVASAILHTTAGHILASKFDQAVGSLMSIFLIFGLAQNPIAVKETKNEMKCPFGPQNAMWGDYFCTCYVQ